MTFLYETVIRYSFKKNSIMKHVLLFIGLMMMSSLVTAQQKMTPELLWKVERMGVMGLDKEASTIYFKVTTPNIEENSYDSKYYKIPVAGGEIVEIKKDEA